jgi:hypothetical protein
MLVGERGVPVDRGDFGPGGIRVAVLIVLESGIPYRIRGVARQPAVGEERTIHTPRPAEVEETPPRLMVPPQLQVQKVDRHLPLSVGRASLDHTIYVCAH